MSPISIRGIRVFLLLGFVFGACGSGSSSVTLIDPSTTACPSGTAAIRVGDGFMQILCGCTDPSESQGRIFGVSEPLTCHLASSQSVVFFHFIGNVNAHQIVSTGSPSFNSSQLVDPKNPNLVLVPAHVARFSTQAATYQFTDIIPGSTGSIIVP